MKVLKGLIRQVLERLYDKYFPDFCDLEGLRDALGPREGGMHLTNIKMVCIYLKDKGLVAEDDGKWRITGQGIDIVERESLVEGD